MAQLTDYTPDIERAKGIAPTKSASGPDVIGGLASIGESLFSGALKSKQTADQEEAKTSLNDAAQSVVDANKQARNLIQLSALPPATQAPQGENDPFNFNPDGLSNGNPDYTPSPAVLDATSTLQSTQKAVQQGRLPQEQLDLVFESKLDDLFRQHPDNKSNILTYLAGHGFSNYLYRDVANQQTADQNQFDEQQAQVKAYQTAATNAGVVSPDTPLDEQISAGRDIMFQAHMAAIAKEKNAEARAQSEFDIKKSEYNMKQADNLAVNARLANIGTLAGSYQQRISNILATNDVDAKSKIGEIIPQLSGAFDQIKTNTLARMAADGVSVDGQNAAAARIDSIKQGVLNFYNGPTSFLAVKQRNLETMQTQFGIDAGKAFPLYSQLSKVMPPQAFALLFSGDPATSLSPEVQKGIRSELSGWTPGAEDGVVHINNIVGMLRGDLKLSSLPQSQQPQALRAAVAATWGVAQHIEQGDKSPENLHSFYNGYSNTLDPAISLQPGSNINDLKAASDVVSGSSARTGLAALKGQENYTTLMQASRATAAHLYKTVEQTGSNTGNFQSLTYDDKSGRWSVNLDTAGYNKSMAGTAGGGGGNSSRSVNLGFTPGGGIPPLTVDSALQRKAELLNENLDHLTLTKNEDPNVIKGMTPLQYRNAVAHGAPTTQPTRAQTDAKVALQSETDKLVTDIQSIPSQISGDLPTVAASQKAKANTENEKLYGPIAEAVAGQHGLDPKVFKRLVQVESSFNPNADANINFPNSHAYGLTQVQPKTAQGLGFHPDDRRDPVKSLHMGAIYLKQLIDKHKGNVKAALNEYSGGSYTDENYQQIIGDQ